MRSYVLTDPLGFEHRVLINAGVHGLENIAHHVERPQRQRLVLLIHNALLTGRMHLVPEGYRVDLPVGSPA